MMPELTLRGSSVLPNGCQSKTHCRGLTELIPQANWSHFRTVVADAVANWSCPEEMKSHEAPTTSGNGGRAGRTGLERVTASGVLVFALLHLLSTLLSILSANGV